MSKQIPIRDVSIKQTPEGLSGEFQVTGDSAGAILDAIRNGTINGLSFKAPPSRDASGQDPVTIRIWNGCKVNMVLTVHNDGHTTSGAVGGAECSTSVDIELDPWAGLIVDNRAEFPAPVLIKEDMNA